MVEVHMREDNSIDGGRFNANGFKCAWQFPSFADGTRWSRID